jgi:uncharacterized protein YfaS (alpha-2-macroglobulin family)
MKNLRVLAFPAFTVAWTLCLVTTILAASVQQKPQLPLQISIAPANQGVTPETIKAGDVVDFKVVATSMVDTTEMRIQVKLADGAELVSGDLSWTGPAGKSEEKQLFFAVRVPATGTGKIQAWLTVSPGGAKPLSRKTQYLLLTGETKEEQIEALKKMNAIHPARKDSKGRPIVEY